MHAFPPASELEGFVGDAIGQLSLDPFQIRFVFRSGRTLVAALRVEHVEPDGRTWPYDCVASEGPPLLLHRLLEQSIVAVAREELCLTLRFNGGAALRVFSDLSPNESGQIWTDGRDWTVF
jgi:hypothetical protein